MKSMSKILLLFVLFFLPEMAQAQTVKDLKGEKENSEKEIRYLNKLLSEAQTNKSVSLNKLNILQQKIVQSKNVLTTLNKEVSYLESHISRNENRIGELQNTRNSMLDLYSKLIYGTWKKRSKTNKLMFIFSSSDFNQAYNRFKYFEQIQEYSKRQIRYIEQVNDSLNVRNAELKRYVDLKNNTLREIAAANKELVEQQNKESVYIGALKKQEKEITRKLKAEQKNRERLAKELDRLIAAQAKKSGGSSTVYKLTPEEQLISDDFAKNKGKLPWPVAEGFISEKFGVNMHPVYKNVQMMNNGVNITTSKSSSIRAVFGGEVTEIWPTPGLNNAVIIRHGNYLTVYSNLVDVNVKKGQKVKTKEVIGTIAFDEDKGSVLNFQIWKNTEKQNPQLWLAK